VDSLLLIVTLLSLAGAFVSLMAVRKLKRNDQLRSDARVAALMTAADAGVPAVSETAPGFMGAGAPARTPSPSRTVAPQAKPSRAGAWNSVSGEMRWNAEPASVPEPAAIRELGLGMRSPEPETQSPSPEAFFGTVQREQPASSRFAFAAALALVVALGGAVIVFTTSNHQKAGAPATQAAHASPLELISLGHSRDASLLTINGIVRNPADGPKLEGLTAVVSLIDDHGGLISTKDVPLDYRALGPGEEAPFKISVPDSGSIARYRVSFRAGTDVVPHVDRRTDTKLASAL
jgi:hypothetical protein